MTEEQERETTELLRGVATDDLIRELGDRVLDTEQVASLLDLTERNNEQESQPESAPEEGDGKIEQWVASVQKRAIWGKVSRETTIEGYELAWGPDYRHYGPDTLSETVESKQVDFLMATIRQSKPEVVQGVNNHFVSIYPASNKDGEGNVVIRFDCFQDRAAETRADYPPVSASCVVPKDVGDSLLNAVDGNSDVFDMFYHLAFPGLDVESANDFEGVRRIKSDGFFLITPDKLTGLPTGMFKFQARGQGDYANRVIGELPKYLYSSPRGVAEPYVK